MSGPVPKPTAAELAFADWLEQLEAGQAADFEALCAERADLAPALRRIHTRWAAMSRAFERIGSSAGTAAPVPAGGPDPATSLGALLESLGGAGGRLDRYALGDEIARGGMGRVVRAFDHELRREVALKLQRGDHGDPRRRRRFLEEAQIAAQLDHPGIVPIHELGLDADGRPFFSMQLVRGQDLGAILARVAAGDPEWTRTRVLNVLLRVCEAVAFAHERGVVHRDLKPANVMVGRFGETYVMDWGLARVHAEPEDGVGLRPGAVLDTVRRDVERGGEAAALLTHDGDVVGTPAYMAPEQASGDTSAAPAVDVYAVGAMLYHLLAGRAPYSSTATPDPETLLRFVREGPPLPLPDAVPAELRAICERAMARRAAERYASMQDLAADLRAFLEVRTVSAYATGRFAELRKWIARNRGITIAAGAVVLSLAIGAAAVTGLWFEAERSRFETAAVGDRLRAELQRSSFRTARQSLLSDNSRGADDALWRMHFAGTMPRATHWALHELAERDPYLVTLPLADDRRPVAFCRELGAVLVGGADGRLEVRDEDTLALRGAIGEPGASINGVAVLQGSATAVVGTTRGEVRVIDVAAGRVLAARAPHDGSVRCVVAGDGDTFVTGGADGTVRWWQGPASEPVTLWKSDVGVTSLAFRPTGDGVAAGDEAGTIRASAFDGSWHVTYRTGSRVTALAFGAHRDELWAGCTDHQLRRFDFVDRTRNLEQPTRNGTCRQLARDTDGSLLVGGWWRIDRVAADGAPLGPVALRGISRWALDAERRRLVTSGAVGGLGIVDLSRGDQRRFAGATGVALAADGRRAATIEGGRAVVRDVASGTEIRRLPRGSGGRVKLDAKGALLAATGGSPSQVQVFAVDSGERLLTLPGPLDDPFGDAVAFAPDGREAAFVVGADRIVRRGRDGAAIGEHTFPGSVIRIGYAAGGDLLLAIARDQCIVRIFDLSSGSHVDHEFRELPGGDAVSLSAAALAPDGRRLAVGTWQGSVLVRDLAEPNRATTTIPAHAGTIWSLAFDRRDPGLLMTAGGAQGVAFWDLDADECCYQTVHDVARQVQLSDDGRTLACLVPDGALLLDLAYRQRHLAGTLDHRLRRLRDQVELPTGREAGLRTWAATVMAEPWPRWR